MYAYGNFTAALSHSGIVTLRHESDTQIICTLPDCVSSDACAILMISSWQVRLTYSVAKLLDVGFKLAHIQDPKGLASLFGNMFQGFGLIMLPAHYFANDQYRACILRRCMVGMSLTKRWWGQPSRHKAMLWVRGYDVSCKVLHPIPVCLQLLHTMYAPCLAFL